MNLLGQQLSLLEIAGTVFGIAGVWLTVRKNILCFPVGIVNVLLYAFLFYQSKLYADAALQVVYIVLLTYGWLQWKNAEQGGNVQVETTSRSEGWSLAAVTLASSAVLGTLLAYLTDASLPYLDSLLTCTSLTAQWMIARRKLENWIVWIVADMVYVGMYIYKDLYLTALLYAIFVILAVAGYMEWKKKLTPDGSAV